MATAIPPPYQVAFSRSAPEAIHRYSLICPRANRSENHRTCRESWAEKLKGEEDLYRIRIEDHRVVYAINDDRLVVLVVRVTHRKTFTALESS